MAVVLSKHQAESASSPHGAGAFSYQIRSIRIGKLVAMAHPASLVRIAGLTAQDIQSIWSLAAAPVRAPRCTAGWPSEKHPHALR